MNQGIRSLLKGRVLLKADCTAGATTISVGHSFPAPYLSHSIPGTMQWWANQSSTAVIVQPSAGDTVSGIEYQENVVIAGLTFAAENIQSTSPLTYSYSVARGAYLRLTTEPTVGAGLKFIEEDMIVGWMSDPPTDDWFPAVIVLEYRVPRSASTNVTWIDQHEFAIRYYMRMEPGVYSRDLLKSRIDDLVHILSCDNYLGGTAYESEIREVILNPTPGQTANSVVETKGSIGLDWGDILLSAKRLNTYLPALH
jgi:hypothetical protein